jgi:cytochrome bd-type quinol oxidase subunit 2
MSDLIKQKQAELLQQQLVEHRQHNHRALKLLKLGLILTFLLYLAFALHLYLGDALSWAAYFMTWQSIVGFFFMLSIIVLTALFLAWVKHHAYLHFGFYGSVTMIVVTVIGFALFAEFFSSSASQDAKSSIQLERSSAFQDTRQNSLNITTDSLLTSRISKARQTLARCDEKVKAGKERHCEGDRAALQALLDSEQSNLQAQIQANTASQAMKYERQDKLKADSYNPVIVMMAQFMAAFSGSDYKEHIKTAVVFIMLIVAVSFEILHHFLSQAKGQSSAAIQALELQIAGLQVGNASSTIKPTPVPSYSQAPAAGISAPTPAMASTATLPAVALNIPAPTEPEPRPIGFVWDTSPKNRVHTPTHPIYQAPTAKLGTAEEQIPLFGTYLGKALATGKANTDTEVKAHLANVQAKAAETVCTHPADRVHTLTHTQNNTQSAAPSLYKEWLAAVHAGNCKPTVRDTRTWVQQRIAGKGSQANRRTSTPVDIDAITTSLFQRAIKDTASRIVANPDYRQGKPKYLLVESN